MELLPAFLKLAGRRVVVVGGGPVAASKLDALLRAGANVTVIAPEIHPAIRDAGIALEERPFTPGDLDDAWFVVAAATAAVNADVAREAGIRRLFVNAVDDPANATVYLGGVVRRAGVTIAISTSGDAPALAGVLREAIDAVLPEDLDRWTGCAREQRATWKRDGVPMAERRPLLIVALKALYP
jgi:uroporphyrin-III C-methyltransferase / precorrin-2 dehydrogenase / sirohydrochlorin ferrochelatase